MGFLIKLGLLALYSIIIIYGGFVYGGVQQGVSVWPLGALEAFLNWEMKYWPNSVYVSFAIIGVLVILVLPPREFRLRYAVPFVPFFLAWCTSMLFIWNSFPSYIGDFSAPISLFLSSKDFVSDVYKHKEEYFSLPVLFLLAAFSFRVLKAIPYFADPSKKKDSDRYGSAEYGSLSIIKDMGLNFKKGLPLAEYASLPSSKKIYLDEPLSVLLLAPPGTGKTTGFVIPMLLNQSDVSMVVSDIKGELVEHTAGFRSTFSKVLIFDVLGETSCRINPLDPNFMPRPELKGEYLKILSSYLIPESKKGVDGYFIMASRRMLLFFMLWLDWYCRSSHDKEGGELIPSFPLLYRIVNASNDRKKLIEKMMQMKGLPDETISLGNDVLSASGASAQWAGVVDTFNQYLSLFQDEPDYPRRSYVLSGRSDVTPLLFREQNTTLYVRARPDEQLILQSLLAMIFEILAKGLMANMPEENHRQVTFLLDEFKNLNRMESMISLPEKGRGYKLNVVFVSQNYKQLHRSYTAEEVESLDNDCAYRIILQMNDFGTASRISQMIGNYTVDKVSTSKNKMKDNSESTSVSQEGIPLVSAQEIQSIPKGECLILCQGYFKEPLKANVSYYYKSREMKKRSRLSLEKNVDEYHAEVIKKYKVMKKQAALIVEEIEAVNLNEQVSSSIPPIDSEDEAMQCVS